MCDSYPRPAQPVPWAMASPSQLSPFGDMDSSSYTFSGGRRCSTFAATTSSSSSSTFSQTFSQSQSQLPPLPQQISRRGAVVDLAYPTIMIQEDEEVSHLEQMRRGSISTAFRGLRLGGCRQREGGWKQASTPLPVLAPMATELLLSPPSSPRSAPVEAVEEEEEEVTEEITQGEEEVGAMFDYPVTAGRQRERERRYEDDQEMGMDEFQKRVFERLIALNTTYPTNTIDTTLLSPSPLSPRSAGDDKFTPPPSPPSRHLPLPLPVSPLSSRRGGISASTSKPKSRKSKSRGGSAPGQLLSPNSSSSASSSSPFSSSSPASKSGRRISLPISSEAGKGSHTSSRGAIKKASSSSACSSRRGSGKSLEVLLEGTVFKKGWSWETA